MFFLYWPCKTVHADASDSWKRIYTKVVTNGRIIKGLLMELTSRHHHNGDSTGNKEIAEQLYKQRQTNGHKCKCPIGRWLQTVITFTERLLGAIPLHTVDQRPPSTSQHAAALLFTSALSLVPFGAASVELACGRKLEIFTVPLKIMDLWWFQPHSCQLPPSPSDPVTTTELCLAYRKERRWINPLSISVVSLWMARSINQNVHTGHSFTAALSSVFTNHTIEFTSKNLQGRKKEWKRRATPVHCLSFSGSYSVLQPRRDCSDSLNQPPPPDSFYSFSCLQKNSRQLSEKGRKKMCECYLKPHLKETGHHNASS